MKKEVKVAKFDAEIVLKQFNTLERAVIDACSMIYLQKIGLLEKLAQQIDLFVPQAIFKETGFDTQFRLKIQGNAENFSPDKQLILLAEQLKCPVISDDGQVLKMAENRGLEYYNSLIMLFYLFFKSKITKRELLAKKSALLGFAYYAPWIKEAGEALFALLSEN